MFVDSANLDFVRETSLSSLFHGFTTNPNLLRSSIYILYLTVLYLFRLLQII